MNTALSQLEKYVGSSIAPVRNLLPHAQAYSMGAAVIAKDKSINTYSSDNPYTHISEAKKMEERVHDYLSSSQGKNFTDYIHLCGKEYLPLKGIGAGDMEENVVAAVLHNDLEALLLSNYSGKTFEQRIEQMAGQYKLPPEAMEEYVIIHELAHLAGYKSEAETEGFLQQYFESRAFQTQGKEREKYVQLAKIAGERKYQAGENKIEKNNLDQENYCSADS